MITPEIIKEQILYSISRQSYSFSDLKVWLWYYAEWTDFLSPGKMEIPIDADIEKFSQKLGMSKYQFATSLRNLKIWKHRVETIDEPAATVEIINSDAVKEIVLYWKDRCDFHISIGEKQQIAELLKTRPGLKENLYRWFQYQERFKDITLTKRKGAYLFGNKFQNFFYNVDKFETEQLFQAILVEHQNRLDGLSSKHYWGFSSDPIEDKSMAIEKERGSICLAMQRGEDYVVPIEHPENFAYYERKKKAREKKT